MSINNWFTWKGVDSRTKGIHVIKAPTPKIGEARVERVTIPGRDGDLTVSDGTVGSVELMFECAVMDPADLPEAVEWLRGSGKLALASRAGCEYSARVIGTVETERRVPGLQWHNLTVTFLCDPYITEVSVPQTYTEAALIVNGHGMSSRPLITAEASVYPMSGTITITNDDVPVSILITGAPYGICIDCDAMIAYKKGDPSVGMNTCITLTDGVWLELLPGTNALGFTSGIRSVTVDPRWRKV